ncbi:hypothetical protein DEJ50_05915 [Streptomyces venezuelae]|uniref:GerMN domain-containing protein n=1 Tax=Streptomyces venezuelae TaxID=54571 RepID=A0A5P2CYS1_STRVZ|nr:hypothetical protein [Streptomyces venezuelae]QES47430.1 hypothetical protein DEJ50_05915 [Streptomyces venezuelae]
MNRRLRPRRGGRPVAAAGAAALLALLLSGCGIEPTWVIESGQAASVSVGDPNGTAMIYLVDPAGRLAPVPRHRYPPYSAPELVRLLMNGPEEADTAAGLTTELPSGPEKDLFHATAFTNRSDGVLEVRVGFPVARLSPLARRQVLCTVAFATPGRGSSELVLTGPDGSLPAERCGLN